MNPRPIQQTDRLLVLLQDAGVRFVVIGGVAAISHGAATLTRDLDIAAPLTPDNVERLMTALRPYHPTHVTRPDLGEIQDSIARLCQLIEVKSFVGRPKDRIVEMELRAIRDRHG